ncbi:MAG: hypothetical protein V1904_11710 [Bacteroidota bacterium]
MNAAEFAKYLDSDKKPDVNAIPVIEELLKKYPFSSCLHMLYTKMLKVSESTETEKYIEKAAVYINDRKFFFRYMNDMPEESIIIQQAVSVYNLELKESEITEDGGQQNDLISKFLNEKPVFVLKNEACNEPDESVCDPEIISETLAEIYLKQGKTDMALNTYKKLCLKFPEKSSYFAARIEKITKGNI